MIPSGKCPKCEAVIRHAQYDEIEIGQAPGGHGRPIYNGFTILCPHCRTVLGAGFDPVSLKVDIVREILTALGVAPSKGKRR